MRGVALSNLNKGLQALAFELGVAQSAVQSPLSPFPNISTREDAVAWPSVEHTTLESDILGLGTQLCYLLGLQR